MQHSQIGTLLRFSLTFLYVRIDIVKIICIRNIQPSIPLASVMDSAVFFYAGGEYLLQLHIEFEKQSD